ncbi:MAG: RluA family pseudouridine synthase [Geminicoccaceae bacterium]
MSGVEHRTVATTDADLRLDRWVKRHFPQLGHVALQKLLRTGQFRVDGKRVESGTRLQPGQVVRVPPLPVAGPLPERAKVRPEDAALLRKLVIHDDDQIVVLNKPAGLAVQGGSKTVRHIDGMLDALERNGERPRLVHRLDRDTSGVLVLARTAAGARSLMHAFQQHRVRKLYWAITMKGPERNEGIVDLGLGKAGPAGRERMSADAEDARPSRTAFRVLLRAGKVGAWTGLMPLTGRTHQLRAHCAAIGAPILGDTKYGGETSLPSQVPPGLMLHAREIDLPHPKGGRFKIAADPPKPFVDALAWLGMQPDKVAYSRLQDWPEFE